MPFKNRFFWIAALISLVVDRLTKVWIVTSFELILPPLPPDSFPLIPGIFHITYVTNTGAAFSIFKDGGGWLRWLSLAVSIGLMLLAWFGPTLSRWEQAGYGFILGGALGNGIDRFIAGMVVDFLDFRLIQFPVFNFADVFINVGIVCLLIASFQKSPPADSNKQPARKRP
jgi:signal peptidase II